MHTSGFPRPNIAFGPGDLVEIAKGATVHTMFPKRGPYQLKRRQAIKVHHILPGTYVRVYAMRDKERSYYPEHAGSYARYDELQLDADTNPDKAAAKALRDEAYDMVICTSPPAVRWPGTGGYWCEAAIEAASLRGRVHQVPAPLHLRACAAACG